MSDKVRRRLGEADGREVLAKRANDSVQAADRLRSKVLYPALRQLALGDQSPKDALDARVDEVFFRQLFRDVELGDDEAALAWSETLAELGRAELDRAIDLCCLPSARRHRSISAAERMFAACLSKQFPDLKQTRNEHGEGPS
jgi:hypothetical protein